MWGRVQGGDWDELKGGRGGLGIYFVKNMISLLLVEGDKRKGRKR